MINFSELLWTSRKPTVDVISDFTKASALKVHEFSSLDLIPVQQVQIEPESRIVMVTEPRGPASDRFRFLSMRLQEVKAAAGLRSMIITSPLPKDGKTTVAMNMATALAKGGKRAVLLIEGDLYNPTCASRLGVQPQPGLADYLERGVDPMPTLRQIEPLNWFLLQAGQSRANPAELLQSDALANLMQKLAPMFEWILIDTPPVVPLTDALLLSQQVDASLLVVRADSTPRETIEESLKLLGREHVLGIIFNGAEGLNRLYPKYSEYYGKK